MEPIGDNRAKKTEMRMWVPFYREISFVQCHKLSQQFQQTLQTCVSFGYKAGGE